MVPSIQIIDATGAQRMFDLVCDSNGEVIIVSKIGRYKYCIPLSTVNQVAQGLQRIKGIDGNLY